MEKLLQARQEVQAEIEAIKSVSVADRVAVKVAELAEKLTAEYEANDAAQLAELEIGLKYIDRAIARAEQDIPVAPVEAEAVEEVPEETADEVKAE